MNIGNITERKLNAKHTFLLEQITLAHVSLIIAVLFEHLDITPSLSGNVGRCIRTACRNTNAVRKHDILIQQSIHYATTEHRAKCATFK